MKFELNHYYRSPRSNRIFLFEGQFDNRLCFKILESDDKSVIGKQFDVALDDFWWLEEVVYCERS